MTLATVAQAAARPQVQPPKPMQKFIEKMDKAGFEYRADVNRLRFPERKMNMADKFKEPLLGTIKRKYFPSSDDLAGLRIPANIYPFTHRETGFNVLAEYKGPFDGFIVGFADPRLPAQKGADGKTGLQLQKNEVVRSYSCNVRRFVGFDAEIDKIIGEINKYSAYKRGDQLFFIAHGHDGWKRDERLLFAGKDDGMSRENDIALSLFKSHKKADLRGMHNNFDIEHFEDMCMLLSSLGITNVPAVEATMPVFLFDVFSVEKFVNDLNFARGEINEFAGTINAEKASLVEESKKLEEQIYEGAKNLKAIQEKMKSVTVAIMQFKGDKTTTTLFTIERRKVKRQLHEARNMRVRLSEEYAKQKKDSASFWKRSQEIDVRLAQLKGREMFELIPEEGVKNPEKNNGGYDMKGVTALIRKYDNLLKVYNSHTNNGNRIAIPVQEANGPHIMIYAESAELMKHVFDKYLSKRIFDFPAYASEIELKSALREMRKEYGARIAIGIAHPVCFSNGKANPAVGILDSARRGDISWKEFIEEIVPYVDTIGAFNFSIKNTKKFSMDPWGPEQLEAIRAEKGELVYQDELKRAQHILEFKARLGEILLEADKDLGIGTDWTVGTINRAFAHYMGKHYGLLVLDDSDIHAYVRRDLDSRYVDHTLYGWSVLEVPGGLKETSPAAWISAIHQAKANKAADAEAKANVQEALVDVYPAIFCDTDNKDKTLDITPKRQENTWTEAIVEAWNYGVVGGFLFVHDLATSIAREKPKTIGQWWHTITRLIR